MKMQSTLPAYFGQQRLQRLQIVAVDNEVVVKARAVRAGQALSASITSSRNGTLR
jgi:hypothetical protein